MLSCTISDFHGWYGSPLHCTTPLLLLILVLRETCELGPPSHPSVLTIGGAAPAQLDLCGD